MHFAEKVEEQKDFKKCHSNNGCSLPNVYTTKYIKIFIHSFIVKIHCLMNNVTAILEYLNLVWNFFERDEGVPPNPPLSYVIESVN